MKKIFNIILMAALLLGAYSCTDLLDPSLRGLGRNQQLLENAKVTVYFGVPEEVTTKADMAAQPSISTMHVFVFNKIGVLIETAVARELGSVTSNGEAGAKHWAVDLQMGAAERHLHFIADLPSDFEIPKTGSEVALIQSITTKTPAAAYWQRIVLANGIDAYKYDGTGEYSYVDPTTGESHTVAVPGTVSGDTYSYEDTEAGETITITVNKGDYINTSGKKVLDAKGLYASESLSRQLTLIPMIRNFARIQLTSSMSGFTIVQAALINTPKEGFVAPYNDIKNEFVYSYTHPDPAHPFTSYDIDTSGYLATAPAAGIAVPTKDPNTQKLVGVSYKTPVTVSGKDSITFFMYERSLPTTNPTSMLVQGTLGTKTKWYKIELADENGSYFPIYRDLTYVLDIKGLSADGYDTPEEAFDNSPVGDLSESTETATLNQINDGKGLTLWVEYIDYTDMDANPNEHTVTLLYKLYHTSSDATPVTTILNDQVEPTIKAYANTDAAIKEFTTAAYRGPDESTPDGKGGWNQATVTLYGVGEHMKKSDLHVFADLTASENPGGYAKKISRNVTYRVLPKQPLTVTATELADEDANEPTTVTITLPANLGYSVFPLTLMIEAGNNALMTTDGLAVESGKSLTGTSSKTNTFYFLKTISASEYEASRVYELNFKTTREGSAANSNATTIYVKDKEGRFDLASCELTVRGQAPIFELSSTGVTVDPDVTTATFSIRSSSTGTWSLTADDENVRFNPSSGTGNRNVTVTFPTNSSNGVATYIVTASIGTSSKTFTITQNPVSFTLSSNAVTLTTPDASSTTFDVNTTSPNTWTVWTEDEGVTLSAAPITRAITASVQGTGKARITVNVPANLEGNTYTIYAECEGFDRQEFTITQPALSLDLSAYDVDVKASATTTSFTVSTNSSSDWTITSANVTSATRSGSDVVVTFPANNTLSTITRTVTVTAGSLEKTFTITQKGLKQVTFYTNDGSAYFPGGRNPVNTRTIEGVKLTFNNSISNRTSTYLEITDNRTFELSSSNGDKITGITITYTDYDHGRSGYRSGNTYLYSSADPSTATGNVYATNSGTTGTWTGEATSVTFTMRNYRSGNSGTGMLQRIAKIEVTIEQ